MNGKLYPPDQPLRPAARAAIRAVVLTEAVDPSAVSTRRHRGLRLAAAAAVITGAIVVSMVVFGGRQPAMAWAAVPDAVSASQAAELSTACAADIAAQHFPVTLDDARPAVAEQRGDFTAVLVEGRADQLGICLSNSTHNGSIGTGSVLRGVVYNLDPVSGLLTLDGVPGQLNGDGAARVAFGRVTPAVSSVLIRTQDGRSVTASVAHGWFLAWWPSGAGVAVVQGLDATGRVIASVAGPIESGLPTPRHR